MKTVQPFGDLAKANILIIGHDPRLQKSQAEAEKPFFFEYLIRSSSTPTYGPDARKYSLAHAVWEYICELAGRPISLDQLYVTNLCNEFLPSPEGGGTVLIPDILAQHGVVEIRGIIARGNFYLILPMSVQVFYHLCRLDFLDEHTNEIQVLIEEARPNARKVDQGAYITYGTAPFLEVCGHLYHHKGIPLIPILHIKQWPLRDRTIRYTGPMNLAKENIRKILS
jgi:hypothetical protein